MGIPQHYTYFIPGSAYGELGCLHSLLGNFEQAISCLQHQLRLAQDMGDQMGEGDAACGLGGVYQQMGEYEKALQFHQLDLQVAEITSNPTCQCEYCSSQLQLYVTTR